MMTSVRAAPILAVIGPTGSGKSTLALKLAAELGGEIVNCDSIQVYRGLDIGSAKTPVEERRGIPHHLLDIVGPTEELTAGAYARIARQVIEGIQERGRFPVVAGGTGFYLRALLDGLSPAPARDSKLRDRLQKLAERRAGSLHRFLGRYDPAAAARIHANDTPKLIRAIEILLLSGKPASDAQAAPRDSFAGVRTLKLGLMPDRRLLYSRLDERTCWLFENGLIEETRRLLAAGYKSDSKPLQSLGYKQALKAISGTASLDDAVQECQAKTRQYAKRQLTWFRAEPDAHWHSGFGSELHVQQRALEESLKFLQSLPNTR